MSGIDTVCHDHLEEWWGVSPMAGLAQIEERSVELGANWEVALFVPAGWREVVAQVPGELLHVPYGVGEA